MTHGGPQSRQSNNFDLLRLAFSAMVIVAHSPEIKDANRSREMLTSLFGTLTLGEAAVIGFFVISGFLVVQSYERSRSVREYLLKRVLRIYPAFLVASFICFVVVGPLAGGPLPRLFSTETADAVFNAIMLQPTRAPGAFPGSIFYTHVNISMWTIAYEFRCYLLVIAIGAAGLFRRRAVMLWLTAAFFAISLAPITAEIPRGWVFVTGGWESADFFAAFFTGALFYLFRDRIAYRPVFVALAALALLGLMFVPFLARTAATVLGAYILFWFALRVRSSFLDRITPREDISYGLYLYGWPVQILVIYSFPNISPWAVTVAALPLAASLGWLSWRFIEGPSLALKPSEGGAGRGGSIAALRAQKAQLRP